MEDILLEMDRILRPEGAVMFRDQDDVLAKVKQIVSGMRWNTKMADHEDHNYYTRSNRESQIPDYDVNLSEPSDNILPSFAYRRQSREFSPKRPTVTTSFLGPSPRSNLIYAIYADIDTSVH